MEEEQDELRSFLTEGRIETCSPSMEEWCAEISAAKSQGKSYQRVRKIQFPLTDYTRFEIVTGFRFSSKAGEQIRLLENEPANLDLTDISDFWLFDDTLCFWLRYDEDGRFIRVDQADVAELKLCVDLKPKLLAASVELRRSSSWRTLFPKGGA